MNFETKIDKRKKYYCILDCETATLNCIDDLPEDKKRQIAIAKPLIYNLGWQIIDRTGKIYKRRSFLITEIFSVPSIFNTAYYADKRPIYLEKLKNKEIILTDWTTATTILENDLQDVDGVGAYNSMFDFKKAIPFTELYITKLYSDDFQKWLNYQNYLIHSKPTTKKKKNKIYFNKDYFIFRNKKYKLFDIWGLTCKYILNNDDFREKAIKNKWYSTSKKYYSTSAETCYKYYTENNNFIESHTAIEDAIIESEIFINILKITKNKFDYGIIFFPFKIIGEVKEM